MNMGIPLELNHETEYFTLNQLNSMVDENQGYGIFGLEVHIYFGEELVSKVYLNSDDVIYFDPDELITSLLGNNAYGIDYAETNQHIDCALINPEKRLELINNIIDLLKLTEELYRGIRGIYE